MILAVLGMLTLGCARAESHKEINQEISNAGPIHELFVVVYP